MGAVRLRGAGPRAARRASETSERAGASGTRDKTTGDDGGGEGGEGNVRATKTKRGTRAGKNRTGDRRAAAWRGHNILPRPGSGGCCRMASAFPNPADAWAATWARIRDLCADVNGAPLVRTPPRRSWGRGPSPLGVAANLQARRSTCLLLPAVQRRRVESLVLGAHSSSPVHRALVLVLWGPT